MNTISLNDWKQVGEGGNGATYIHPSQPDVILKVSYLDDTEETMSQEFTASKAVYDLGLPTPQMMELVRVGKGVGIISQLISNKKSIARLCNEQPEHIEALARQMAEQTRRLHATVVPPTSPLPSMKERMIEAVRLTRMIGGKKRQALIEYLTNLPDAPTLLHGDLQMGNLIMDGEQPYWIDLGRAAYGMPMFDLGHLYLFCNIFSRTPKVQQIAHMTGQQMMTFWKTFAEAYLLLSTADVEQSGLSTIEAFTAECKRFAAFNVILLGHIQTLNWHQRLFLGLLAKRLFKAD